MSSPDNTDAAAAANTPVAATDPDVARVDAPDQPVTGSLNLGAYHERLEQLDPYRMNGRVIQVIGLVIEANGPEAQIGELCHIHVSRHADPVAAEVVGFREGSTLLMPVGEMRGIAPGNEVVATGHPLRVGVGTGLLGRVVNGAGEPLDGKGPIELEEWRSLHADPPSPMTRPRIDEQLELGVRAMDGLIPCGKGHAAGCVLGFGCRQELADGHDCA